MDRITTSMSLDQNLDSITMIEFVMELEDELGFTIPDSDFERIKTVADAIRYIKERRNG